jgi:hypothetical protein
MDQTEMKQWLERLMARMDAKLDSSQERTNANLEEMKATIRSGQEETRAAINSVRSELEETIRTWAQGLRAELDEEIMKTQQQVQEIMATMNKRTGNLQEDMTDVRKNLCEAIGRMRAELDVRAQGLDNRIAEVKVQVELGVGSRTGNDARWAKPPKFDGSTSWTMFRRQFETAADHNRWMPREVTYLIAALQGRAYYVLHGVPRGAMYEETIEALEDCFRDQHLAAAYRSQLKMRTQKAGESLQEFATTIEQLAHCAYPALPEDHVRKEAGRAFTDGVEDPDIKIQLLLGGEFHRAQRRDQELPVR